MDLKTGEIFQVIEVGGAPFGGAIGPNDVLYLENGMMGIILKVDLINGHELTGIELPTYGTSFNYASAIFPLPGLICATDFNSDRLYLIDPVTDSILTELLTGDGPDSIVQVY